MVPDRLETVSPCPSGSFDTPATSGSPVDEVPRPPGWPFLGALPELRKNPLEFLVRTAREHGDVVQLGKVGSRRFFLVSHPDDLERILKTNHTNYVKGANFQLLKSLAGEGLFLSENDYWRKQRKLIQPAFHVSRLTAMGGTITAAAESLCDRWQRAESEGEPVEIEKEMVGTILEIAVKTLFGADLEPRWVEAIHESVTTAFAYFHQRVWTPGLPLWAPTPANLRFKRALARLDEIVFRIVDERRASGDLSGEDVLSMLLSVRDEDGEAMTDRQIRDEVMTLLVAGHESTALTLTWTLYLIARYPLIERRLHRELDEVLEGRRPSFEDLRRLPYLRQVLQESMRLYPAFWVFTRTPVEDDVLGGYRIPAGSVLLLSCFVTHRDRRFWDHPEGVDPDRFSPERSAKRPELAYYPFGGGPRRCIGSRLAEMEASMVLATVAQRYSLHLLPGRNVVPAATLSLRPEGGLPMTLYRRPSAVSAQPLESEREAIPA